MSAETLNAGTQEPHQEGQTASGEPVLSGVSTEGSSTAASPAAGALVEQIVATLKTCFDPEIPVDIYELGLVYNVAVDPPGRVSIQMTLTSPACPVAGSLPPEVEAKVRSVPGVTDATVEVVWDPPWTPAMMSEAARLQLNMY